MADRLQIAPRHRRTLEGLLLKCLPGVEVWAYGSRVNGRGHEGSDLDLVLRTPDQQKLPVGQLLGFQDAIRESTIPFRGGPRLGSFAGTVSSGDRAGLRRDGRRRRG